MLQVCSIAAEHEVKGDGWSNAAACPRCLQAMEWLHDDSWHSALSLNYSRGLVFETLWHVVFGREAVLQIPPHEQQCDILGCDEQQGDTASQRRRLTP